jgi:hypothetical protein
LPAPVTAMILPSTFMAASSALPRTASHPHGAMPWDGSGW